MRFLKIMPPMVIGSDILMKIAHFLGGKTCAFTALISFGVFMPLFWQMPRAASMPRATRLARAKRPLQLPPMQREASCPAPCYSQRLNPRLERGGDHYGLKGFAPNRGCSGRPLSARCVDHSLIALDVSVEKFSSNPSHINTSRQICRNPQAFSNVN